MSLSELEKQEQAVSIERKYGKRKNFKHLRNNAHREIYREDILQPMQSDFKTVYKNKVLIQEAEERHDIQVSKKKEEEMNEAYLKNGRNILTIEQKILKDLQKEHPKLVKDEDIIKCNQTTSTLNQ